jgi:hypothetical protein
MIGLRDSSPYVFRVVLGRRRPWMHNVNLDICFGTTDGSDQIRQILKRDERAVDINLASLSWETGHEDLRSSRFV